MSHDHFHHVLDLSCDPLATLQYFPTLFDPGGKCTKGEKNHTSSLTLLDPGGSHDTDLLIVTVSELDLSGIDLSLTSVPTLVYDPGGAM